jgi:hypothetical protein
MRILTSFKAEGIARDFMLKKTISSIMKKWRCSYSTIEAIKNGNHTSLSTATKKKLAKFSVASSVPAMVSIGEVRRKKPKEMPIPVVFPSSKRRSDILVTLIRENIWLRGQLDAFLTCNR